MLELITDPNNPILRQRCTITQTIDMAVLKEMFGLMLMHNGAGLAAPQVGISKRFFITHWGEVFVNPRASFETSLSNSVYSTEGCLSIPGKQFRIVRSNLLWVDGKEYRGEQAFVIQHEMDHLNGVLICDKGQEINGTYIPDSASRPKARQ